MTSALAPLPRTPRRRRRSSTLTAIAGLCLLVQVLGVVHLILVRHERCPTHGEVTHGPALHEDGDVAAAPSSGPAATVRAQRVNDDLHDRDDHCQSLTERRDVDHAAPPGLLAAPTHSRAHAPPPTILPARTCALYRLAPKLSPPHAA